MQQPDGGTQRFNIEQAAQRLGLAVITLRRKIAQGVITCYRPSGLGRKILFAEEHLREFEERHTFRAKGVQQ